EVLVPSPSYPLFQFLADVLDVKLVPYPLLYDHGWHMDFATLRQQVTTRSRAVVVVHPNNPTGSYVHDAERDALNEICSARDMAIIADEVFLDFAQTSTHAKSFACNEAALTFTLSGLSKISALPQMKLAWIVTSGPQEIAATALQRLEIIADTFLSVSTPVQLAGPALLAEYESIQNQ